MDIYCYIGRHLKQLAERKQKVLYNCRYNKIFYCLLIKTALFLDERNSLNQKSIGTTTAFTQIVMNQTYGKAIQTNNKLVRDASTQMERYKAHEIGSQTVAKSTNNGETQTNLPSTQTGETQTNVILKTLKTTDSQSKHIQPKIVVLFI